MPSHGVSILLTLLQRTNRECVAQVVDARTTARCHRSQSGIVQQTPEGGQNSGVDERLPGRGHKHRLGIDRPTGTLVEVPAHCSLCRLVQRNETTLAVLGFANQEAIDRYVPTLKYQRLGDA